MKLPYTGYLRSPSGPALLYYITDRRQFPGDAAKQKRRLLNKIAECVDAGVDFVQLREKDLSTRELEELATEAAALFRPEGHTRFLVNSRIDVALACGAHGAHLPANDLSASEARAIFEKAGQAGPVIAVSAHSVAELAYAESHGADFAVFGPVFEKDVRAITGGIERLREACARANRTMPVLALGGITVENIRQCMEAGADGIAGIRLFQENRVEEIASGVNRKGR
jgi:thiamine-phosphate pyrophosphorylase